MTEQNETINVTKMRVAEIELRDSNPLNMKEKAKSFFKQVVGCVAENEKSIWYHKQAIEALKIQVAELEERLAMVEGGR